MDLWKTLVANNGLYLENFQHLLYASTTLWLYIFAVYQIKSHSSCLNSETPMAGQQNPSP